MITSVLEWARGNEFGLVAGFIYGLNSISYGVYACLPFEGISIQPSPRSVAFLDFSLSIF